MPKVHRWLMFQYESVWLTHYQERYSIRALQDDDGKIYVKASDFVLACGFKSNLNKKMYEFLPDRMKACVTYKWFDKEDKQELDDYCFYFYGRGTSYLTYEGAQNFYDMAVSFRGESKRDSEPAKLFLEKVKEAFANECNGTLVTLRKLIR